jgi:hypothetical protein
MPVEATVSPVRHDVAGTLTLTARREACLRSEHARCYPGIVPGRWESAATLADRVLAGGLLRGIATGWRDRILPDAHFEFRGGNAASRERPMREDR